MGEAPRSGVPPTYRAAKGVDVAELTIASPRHECGSDAVLDSVRSDGPPALGYELVVSAAPW